MRAQTEKTTFSCKDNSALTKHTQRWTYYAVRYFSILNIVLYFVKLKSFQTYKELFYRGCSQSWLISPSAS